MPSISVQSRIIDTRAIEKARPETESPKAGVIALMVVILVLSGVSVAILDDDNTVLASTDADFETVQTLSTQSSSVSAKETIIAPLVVLPEEAGTTVTASIMPDGADAPDDATAELASLRDATRSASEPLISDRLAPPPDGLVGDGTASLERSAQTPRANEPTENAWLASAPVKSRDGVKSLSGLRVHVMTADHAWAFGRSDAVSGPQGRLLLHDTLKDPYIRAEICGAPAVVALGAASHEGDDTLNHALADARATALAIALKATAARCIEPPRVFSASLGRNTIPLPCPDGPPCPSVTAIQRPVALVSISGDIRTEASLRDVLTSAKVLATDETGSSTMFRLSDYDLFESAPIERL